MSSDPKRIVVVGASLAGLRGARAIRELGFDGELLVVGDEQAPPYDRPPLSKQLLAGDWEPAQTALKGADTLEAEWLLGVRAEGLDCARRRLKLSTGETLRWDRLLLATGSRARRLAALDPELPGVHELRTLDDALALRAALAGHSRLVIVGSGFIGIEVASTARALGLEVEIATLDPPLAPAGPIVTELLVALLAEHGVRLHSGRTVIAVEGTARCERLLLDDGSSLEGDLVLSAVGAQPATDWLRDSGLVLADGVVCDSWCAALGADGVAAAGDIARWPNPCYGGRSMRVEHWSNAVEQARIAAHTLLHGPGHGPPYAAVPSFWSEHFGLRLQSVGLPNLADEFELVEGDTRERRFVAAARLRGQLVGAVAYGMPRPLLRLRNELAEGVGDLESVL